jgi:hypothetical protein
MQYQSLSTCIDFNTDIIQNNREYGILIKVLILKNDLEK